MHYSCFLSKASIYIQFGLYMYTYNNAKSVLIQCVIRSKNGFLVRTRIQELSIIGLYWIGTTSSYLLISCAYQCILKLLALYTAYLLWAVQRFLRNNLYNSSLTNLSKLMILGNLDHVQNCSEIANGWLLFFLSI
jgi:hypothetical protein